METEEEKLKRDADIAMFRFGLIAPTLNKTLDKSATSYFKEIARKPVTPATQNVFKYTQHIEKLKPSRVLLTASMCMLWWLQATHYSQVLVHSTVVNSCDSPQYTLTLA